VALTESERVDSPRSPFSAGALFGRVREWLADPSHNALAQKLAGAAFLIRVASAALLYLSQALLARWMGSFAFGVYVYVWTVVLLVGGVFDLGLAQSAQRFIPEYTGRKQFDLLRGFLFGSYGLVVGIAIVSAIAAAFGLWLCARWVPPYLLTPLYLACLCLPFFALTQIQDGIGRAYGWLHIGLAPPYLLRPLLLIAMTGVAYAAGSIVDANVAMMAACAATATTSLVQFALMQQRLARTMPAGGRAYALRIWLATSLPIFLVEGFYMLLTYTDVLLLQQFRSPEEIAVYYAAAKTLALVAFVNFSVAAAVAHRFSEYHVAGDTERLSAFLAESIRWTFWPSLAATAMILALGLPFLWLFGSEFTAGYPIMFLLAVGLLSRAAIGPVERLLNMLGQQKICAAVYAVAFVLNVAFCLALVPRFGGVGAAIATSTALLVESALLFVVTKRRLGLHVFIWRTREN
jgi:O-antigen/teichoic acid export membrane protein